MQRSSARTGDHSEILVLGAPLRAQSATFDTHATESLGSSDPDEPEVQAGPVAGSGRDLLEQLQHTEGIPDA